MINRTIKNGKGINMPYVAKPKPCYMDQFEFYKVIDGRKVYRGNRICFNHLRRISIEGK